MFFSKLIHAILRPIWRVRRGLTMGVQGIVVKRDSAGKLTEVLLVEHSYRPGWHFPGGGVEWGEHAALSLQRELKEEANIDLTGPVKLLGIFANFKKFPGDHIMVFLIDDWHMEEIPAPNMEIRAVKFFKVNELPDDMAGGARARLEEILQGKAPSAHWV